MKLHTFLVALVIFSEKVQVTEYLGTFVVLTLLTIAKPKQPC